MGEQQVRVGVALSSGGAAGMAHVGVLEALIAAGIVPEVVAGTSAGSMVGAAYAAGQLEGFRQVMCGLTRSRVLRLFDPTWPQSGLLEGRRPLDLIRPHIGSRIEDLRFPYAAVATDLRSGCEVVLRSGSVARAIRASSAVPGIFTPILWNGKVLVDGGLVNPVPVDVVRALGADVVVASTVIPIPQAPLARQEEELSGSILSAFLARFSADTPAPEPPPATPPEDDLADTAEMGIFDVLSRASEVVQSRVALARMRDSPPDLLVQISVSHIGLFDFHLSTEAVEAGREAMGRMVPQLRERIAQRRGVTGRWPWRLRRR